MRFVTSALMIGSLIAGIAACSGDDNPTVVDNGKTISELDLTDQTLMSDGKQTQYMAVVKYSDGSSKDVTRDPDTIWNTSDSDVATVDDEGLVKAVSEGTVTISATYKGVKETDDFAVTP